MEKETTMKKLLSFGIMCLAALTVMAQDIRNNPGSNHGNKFEQLGTILPDGNQYRTSSGAPGKEYWQQKANYVMDIHLDDAKQMFDDYFNSKKETYVTEAGDIEKWDGGSIDPEYIKMVKANIKRLRETEI